MMEQNEHRSSSTKIASARSTTAVHQVQPDQRRAGQRQGPAQQAGRGLPVAAR
jgi:hypothetical protein